ncbi:MAG: hypothetical protein ACKV2U_22855 [Bryobacteraceae bacterium]
MCARFERNPVQRCRLAEQAAILFSGQTPCHVVLIAVARRNWPRRPPSLYLSRLKASAKNGDGVISTPERRAYAERVLSDLSLVVDGDRLKLDPISASFPKTDAIKEGLGETQIDFAAKVSGGNPERRLVFENRHQRQIAAYMVNCLAPVDRDIRITAQNRDYEQSRYQLDYVQGGLRAGPLWSDGRGWLASVLIVPLARHGVLWRRRHA